MQDEPTPSRGPHILVTSAKRAACRAVRFAGGFVAGLLLMPVVFVGGFIATLIFSLVAGQLDGQRHTSGWHVSSGRDISGAGGATVVWERPGEITRQTCRGACDDLAFAHVPAEPVEVLGASGRILVRKTPWPASLFAGTSGEEAWRPQLRRVAGTPP